MSRIIFVCTGNSCRSQMAEGWARHLSHHEVASAGIEAHGLNSRALEVMDEAGVDIGEQTSNTLDEYRLSDFDVVVTVCGHADEHCPVLPRNVEKHHWPLIDPAQLRGSEEEIRIGFRASRDEIRRRVIDLLNELS